MAKVRCTIAEARVERLISQPAIELVPLRGAARSEMFELRLPRARSAHSRKVLKLHTAVDAERVLVGGPLLGRHSQDHLWAEGVKLCPQLRERCRWRQDHVHIQHQNLVDVHQAIQEWFPQVDACLGSTAALFLARQIVVLHTRV